MNRQLIGTVLLVVITAFLTRTFFAPKPEVIYENVEVPVEVIVEQEPDTVIRWRDRIVYRFPPPVQTAVAIGGGQGDLDAFCRPVTMVQTDTVVILPPERLLLRSVESGNSWWGRSASVDFVGPTSYGNLKALHYDLRPGWSARVSGDSLLIREPRWGLVTQILEFGIPLTLGYGIGKVF